ncbi:hypothetical protein TVAG_041980 [Trichomonas vaginalis G3]|uniref:Calcineurin-like phosphoesterase domain-containing protein n=1 Tax=Trichomonas vaginalis (strain ATCC PRA-98 / G3) TaxID=412133 RepID=A2EUT7_TRIV3|nr:helicase related family [Trichomonas vaginalis G3]EAY03546.1 hypothetical protein TVAG_041980 [Trichomonas vaginalis G3]KAI5550047.1 helicase related family [Trichomonas vaginalis G3]|eukprot:XP_001315769.1 hypothetical protein [Trichomonas vaginalis G3]
MVDSADSTSPFSAYYSNKDDWEIYNNSVLPLIRKGNHEYFEIAGNHDLMNVKSFNSPANYYKYYVSENETDLYARKIVLNTTHEKYNVILFNPVTVPFPSALLGCMPYVAKAQMDMIEQLYEPNVSTIWVCHYPRQYLRSAKSYKGNSLHDLLRDGKLYICGHAHPEEPMLFHIDGYLSIVATALLRKSTAILYTVDNGAINAHIFDSMEEQSLFITYPQIKKQVSKHSVFNLNDFPVRVIAVKDNEWVKVRIDGEEYGNMTFINRTDRNHSFYSLDVHVENGEHTLEVYDNNGYSEEIEFFVGEKSKRFTERKLRIHIPIFYFIVTPGIVIFYLLMLLPFWKLFPAQLKEIDDYIDNPDSEMNFFKASLLSFLYVFCRFRKVPIWIIILLLVFVLILFVIPIWIQRVERQIKCVVFIWGAYMEGHLVYFVVQFWVLFLALLFIMTGMIWFVAIVYDQPFMTKLHVFEIVISVLLNVIGNIAWCCVAYAADNAWTYFCSPSTYFYTIIPIVLYFYTYFDKRKIRIIEESDAPKP